MDSQAMLLELNRQIHQAFVRVIKDLSDVQIHISASEIDERPITEVALHAYSCLIGILSVVSGGEWSVRKWPISAAPPDVLPVTSAASLQAVIASLDRQVNEILAGVDSQRLAQQVRLPWGYEHAGTAAVDGFVHALQHAGAIAGIRAIAGFPTPSDS